MTNIVFQTGDHFIRSLPRLSLSRVGFRMIGRYRWEQGITDHTLYAEWKVKIRRSHPIVRNVPDYELIDELYYSVQIEAGMSAEMHAYAEFGPAQGLLSFVGAWNNFFLPLLVLSREDLLPLTVGMAVWNQSSVMTGGQPVYTFIAMGSILSIVPLLVAFILFGRYWRSGLAAGSVK